eukprot:315378_1
MRFHFKFKKTIKKHQMSSTVESWMTVHQMSSTIESYWSNPPLKLSNMSEWLSMRCLLKTINEDTIEGCYDEIVESFDNKKDIISILIQNATADQITQIIKIFGSDRSVLSTILHKDIPLTQIKNVTKILNNAQNEETNIIHQNDNNSNNKSYFDYISKESIFNICEFLDKTS